MASSFSRLPDDEARDIFLSLKYSAVDQAALPFSKWLRCNGYSCTAVGGSGDRMVFVGLSGGVRCGLFGRELLCACGICGYCLFARGLRVRGICVRFILLRGVLLSELFVDGYGKDHGDGADAGVMADVFERGGIVREV